MSRRNYVYHGIQNLNQIWSSHSGIVSFLLYDVLWVQTSKLQWIGPKPLSASGLAFHFPNGCGSWITTRRILEYQIMWGWLLLLSAWVRGLKKPSSSSLAVFGCQTQQTLDFVPKPFFIVPLVNNDQIRLEDALWFFSQKSVSLNNNDKMFRKA